MKRICFVFLSRYQKTETVKHMQYHTLTQRPFREDWSIFPTLISNVALLMSLRIRSVPNIKTKGEAERYDIGMLGLPPGPSQLEKEKFFIQCLTAALISECLANYLELKKAHPVLKDTDLEAFLDGLEDRNKFLLGMKKLRDTIFHLNSKKNWEHPDVKFLFEMLGKQTVVAEVLITLIELLLSFIDRNLESALQPE